MRAPHHRFESSGLGLGAILHKPKKLIERIGLALNSGHLDDRDDAPATACRTTGLHDDVDTVRDISAKRARFRAHLRQPDQDLQPVHRFARIVGVNRCHRPVMARAHRLEHVDRFLAADFAQNNSVGPHSQAVAHEVAGRDLGPGIVGATRPCLQTNDVALLKADLRGILDRHDALFDSDIAAERIEQRRLSRTRAAANQDVQARIDRRGEIGKHFAGHHFDADQFLRPERLSAELADRQHRAVKRHGRNDDVHSRTVGEPRVNIGRRLVNSAAHRSDDALNDIHQMHVVPEARVPLLQLAIALYIDGLVAVDDDVVDRLIVEERLNGPEPGELVIDLLDDL